MKEVTKNGVTEKVQVMEIVWGGNEKFVFPIVHLNGYYADALGYICPIGKKYNPKTGEDVPIGVGLEHETQERERKEKEAQEREKSILLGSIDKTRGILSVPYGVIKLPFSELNRFLASDFATFYLGNYWLMNRIMSHDVFWWTRKGLGPAVRRRERSRNIRITRVSTSFDVVEKPAKDKFGFSWKVLVTIQYRIRNIGKAWIEIPDSDNQMIQLVRSAFIQFWQEQYVLLYEGVEILDKKTKAPLSKEDKEKAINDSLADQFLLYLKAKIPGQTEDENLWLQILNDLGREIDKIAIDDKELTEKYADEIARVRKAELAKIEEILLAEGQGEGMARIAAGMDSQLIVIKKADDIGKLALLSGLFSAQGKATPVEELTTATLFKDQLIGGVMPKSGGRTSNGRKEFHRAERKQGGENK